MSSVKSVALIGAGNMGGPMARCLYQAGFELLVCDTNAEVRSAFAQDGIPVTASAGDCASADAILVLVANDAQIMSVTSALADAVPAGQHPVICIMSTTLPGTLNQVRARIEPTGARLIDAPISGGIVKAREGRLTVMAGGTSEDVQRVRPAFDTFAERVFHCGSLGTASVTKVLNNILGITSMFLTAETIAIGQRNGLSFAQIAPIVETSTGRNFLTADAEQGMAQYQAWARTEALFHDMMRIVSKDLHLALDLAASSGFSAPLLAAISAQVDASDDRTIANWVKIANEIAP
ncbi:NAD(P)-dependent oxidoreductase [Paraburkholderia fungorum]|uniref:NAD(P)-dependent oxidoreductase n=1 Tax=Paraburkholderia fungorum TaxID=134537 RepID=UPI0020969224|nr:NAD(P)-dependent oxidoreductase [Paraburkholderia fungorum]USX06822.1 NAD(P)-dependent oxidoreductase [Paraburkholderia fungorum]